MTSSLTVRDSRFSPAAIAPYIAQQTASVGGKRLPAVETQPSGELVMLLNAERTLLAVAATGLVTRSAPSGRNNQWVNVDREDNQMLLLARYSLPVLASNWLLMWTHIHKTPGKKAAPYMMNQGRRFACRHYFRYWRVLDDTSRSSRDGKCLIYYSQYRRTWSDAVSFVCALACLRRAWWFCLWRMWFIERNTLNWFRNEIKIYWNY